MLTTGVPIVGALTGLGWWLSGQFRKVERSSEAQFQALLSRIDTAKDSLEEKLNHHEIRDNERFEAINLSILKIEMREHSNGKIVGPYQV